MGDLEWLNGHSGQGTAELLALEGRFRTDSLVLAFDEAISGKATRIRLAFIKSQADQIVTP